MIDEADRRLRPFDDLVDAAAHRVAISTLSALLTPPGMTPVPWMRLPAIWRMTSWPNLRVSTPCLARSGKAAATPMMLRLRDLALEAEQEVGRGEMEEVQRVRLDDLPVVQQPAQLLRRRRQGPEARDEVHRLGRGEQMADRADAAQPLHGDRHFPVRAGPR